MSNIIVVDGTYMDNDALFDVLNYCEQNALDTECVGVNAESVETMVADMMFVKQYYRKEEYKKLAHIVINVTPYKKKHVLSDKESRICYYTMLNLIWYVESTIIQRGYQHCIFSHVRPTDNVPHLHIIINTTNMADGKQIASVTDLAYEIHKILAEKYKELEWCGVLFNKPKPYKEMRRR